MRIQRTTRSVPVRGPAPVPHQVREVTLRVESLPDGGLRVSTAQARGWAMVARNERELNRAVSAAFTEAQVAAYSRWRGERYDLDELTEPVAGDPMAPERSPARRRRNGHEVGWGRNQRRPDAHSPEDWVKLPDGRWQSPGGKSWSADSALVQRVVARRQQFNLPT